ncbi:MAG: hypothetical protein RLZZ382_261 [Bacteroidota bacterium]|jgi:hypothetical protein
MKQLVLFVALISAPWITVAQEPNTYVSSKEITVGGILEVQYEISLLKNQDIAFNPPLGYFPCNRISAKSNLKGTEFKELEILSYSDTIIDSGGSKLWRANFKLIPWDTGTLVLQPLPYSVDSQMNYFTSILVQSTFVPAKKGVRIYDINESNTPFKKELVLTEVLSKYWWIPLLLLFIGLFIVVYKKRTKSSLIEPESLTLKQQTLQSIEKLVAKQQWSTDQKLHYTELSFILRWYLSSRYNINLLERTTFETILLLKALKLDEYLITQISLIFKEVDAVKFANSELPASDHEKLIEWSKEVVIISSPVETSHV